MVAAGTMLQGTGTGPVAEAGAEARTEAVASSMSMSQFSKSVTSGATELVGARAKARAGAGEVAEAFVVSTPNVVVAKGNEVTSLLIALGIEFDTFEVFEATEEEEAEALAEEEE